ncbi:hypothetical protein E2562_011032 [Oryza meyeriana var. granulata]|uniref:Uncharacterized protein n=1 Tax=Oryza meyeriana var. granulata TaxID=110450 RepID=A0A6G1EWD0_9ORYZ|nr:hypothetical protein E2562_011032 [Oryza meyeriana var. granulata]
MSAGSVREPPNAAPRFPLAAAHEIPDAENVAAAMGVGGGVALPRITRVFAPVGKQVHLSSIPPQLAHFASRES